MSDMIWFGNYIITRWEALAILVGTPIVLVTMVIIAFTLFMKNVD